MKIVIFLFLTICLTLYGKEKNIQSDVKQHYYNLATRVEGHILEDHEYYMTSQIKSYDLQSVLNVNRELLSLLNNDKVLENDLMKLGNLLLEKLNESQVEKIMTLPESLPKKQSNL